MDFTCTNNYTHNFACIHALHVSYFLKTTRIIVFVSCCTGILDPCSCFERTIIIILLSLLQSIIPCFCIFLSQSACLFLRNFCDNVEDLHCIFILSVVAISIILMNPWSAVHWCWDHGISDCFCASMPVLSDEWDAPASSQWCNTGFSGLSNMANCILSSGCCAFLPRNGKWSSRSTKRWLVPGSEKKVMGEKLC